MACDILQTLIKSEWLKTLAGGFIGSVVGAGATVLATRAMIRGTIETNEKMLKAQNKQQLETLFQGRMADIQENLICLTDIESTQGYHDKIRLSLDFWNDAKGYLHRLPADLQKNLIETHTLISRHNELIILERKAGGLHGNPINKMRNKLKDMLLKIENDLSEHLKKNR